MQAMMGITHRPSRRQFVAGAAVAAGMIAAASQLGRPALAEESSEADAEASSGAQEVDVAGTANGVSGGTIK